MQFLEVKKTLLPYLDVLLPVEEVLGRRRVHSIISVSGHAPQYTITHRHSCMAMQITSIHSCL